MDPNTQRWTIRRTAPNHWLHAFILLLSLFRHSSWSQGRVRPPPSVSDFNALTDYHEIRYSSGWQKKKDVGQGVSFAKIDSVKTSVTGANKILPHAWLQTSAANAMRSSLFWVVKLHGMVVSDVSGQPIDPIFTTNLRYLTSQKRKDVKFRPTSHIFASGLGNIRQKYWTQKWPLIVKIDVVNPILYYGA